MRISQWKNAERRAVPRGRLQLELALIYPVHPERAGGPARPMFYGKTRDISTYGLSIIVDQNIYQEGEVVVVLALPPTDDGAPRKVATSTAEMTYSIYSSKLRAYKVGLVFRQFRGDGKALLQAALAQAPGDEAIAGMHGAGGRLLAQPGNV